MIRLPLRLLPVVLLLAVAAVAWGQFSDAADKVRDAVVTVTADKSVGAGFIVNAEGYALTNNHVVDKAKSVKVRLRNGDEVAAEVVEAAAARDLCLLKLDRQHLPAVQFASSAKLKQGDEVAAVGAPFGLPNSLSTGTVSATEREIDGQQFIQIDAPLNKGNSGGPVINKSGLVVGVASKAVKEGQDLGFAIPSDEVMAFLGSKNVAFEAALGDAPRTATESASEGSTEGAAGSGDEGAEEPATSAAPALPPAAPAAPPSPLSRPWAILAAAAVVAFLVALVTALVVARQKAVASLAPQQPVQQYGYAPPPQAPPPGAAPRPAAPPQPPPPEDLSDIDIQLR